MKIGFVGNGTDKFTAKGELAARAFIAERLTFNGRPTAMVSGHSPVGGIDIWAEEVAVFLNIPLDLKIPQVQAWNPPGGYGYKARNLDIARDSDVLYVVLADAYPPAYAGRRFELCYHCVRTRPELQHVKSGGCWTGNQALRLGKDVRWQVVSNL